MTRTVHSTVGSGVFDAPRRTLIGSGLLADLVELIRAEYPDSTSVLVVADRFVASSGVLEPFLSALRSRAIESGVFADIDTEPTEEAVNLALGVAEPGAIIIGIGGGSAMDTAKLVAVVAGGRLTGTDFGVRALTGALGAEQPVAPLILVPTTTGTGAEATKIAMVTIDGAKVAVSGRQLVADIAVLDHQLVQTLPSALVASTGMDAIAHAVEAVFSTSRTQLSLQASFSALEVLLEAVPAAATNAGDADARAAAQIGAYYSGLALNAGVVVGHSIAYGVGHFAQLPHGLSSGLALPYCLAYNDPERDAGADDTTRALSARLAQALTGGQSRSLRDAADAVVSLLRRLDMPVSLREVGLSAVQATDIADRCIQFHPRPTNPRPLEQSALRNLLAAALVGDLDGAWRS